MNYKESNYKDKGTQFCINAIALRTLPYLTLAPLFILLPD